MTTGRINQVANFFFLRYVFLKLVMTCFFECKKKKTKGGRKLLSIPLHTSGNKQDSKKSFSGAFLHTLEVILLTIKLDAICQMLKQHQPNFQSKKKEKRSSNF